MYLKKLVGILLKMMASGENSSRIFENSNPQDHHEFHPPRDHDFLDAHSRTIVTPVDNASSQKCRLIAKRIQNDRENVTKSTSRRIVPEITNSRGRADRLIMS